MNPCFAVIDNFYDDPYSVRDYALTCEYDTPNTSGNFTYGNAPWPGKMSKKPYMVSGLDLKVSRLLKRNVIQQLGKDSGKFRISKYNDKSSNLVHADGVLNQNTLYAGVVYLNPNVTDVEGTIFYKNKLTGKNILESKEDYSNIITSQQDKSLDYWQRELVSYIVWNRLIIYPGHYFHGIGPLFGDSDESARLVQVFFWESIK